MAGVGAQCISRGGLGFLQFPGPQIYTLTPVHMDASTELDHDTMVADDLAS